MGGVHASNNLATSKISDACGRARHRSSGPIQFTRRFQRCSSAHACWVVLCQAFFSSTGRHSECPSLLDV